MTREHEKACALSGEHMEELLRQHARRPLPKRFYQQVEVAAAADGVGDGASAGVSAGAAAGTVGAFAVLLDGRALRTPLKRPLLLPSRALAEAIAAEWRAQERHIDPATMPLTGLANAAIDKADATAADNERAALLAHLRELAGHDLLCYRADAASQPQLAQAQRRCWDPLLQWAEQALHAPLRVAQGIMPVAQSPQAVDTLLRPFQAADAFRLVAGFSLATLARSVVLALAVLHRRLTAPQAWDAAVLEEHWNMRQWGEDAQAAAVLARRREAFLAAERFLQLLPGT